MLSRPTEGLMSKLQNRDFFYFLEENKMLSIVKAELD